MPDAPLARPPAHPRRLVYLGTPAMAVPPLEALHRAGYDIALVVSRADKRRGRGARAAGSGGAGARAAGSGGAGALSPSPVKQAALDLGLPVSDRVEDVLDADADLGVVVAFGRLIKRPVLERLALINLHFSLLPRWRGAAPVERAILAGDERTGVDLMDVEEGLDTGAVYAEAVVDIGPDETAAELRERLVAAGTDLLLSTLAAGLGTPVPQTGEATYAAKLDPDELHLDWNRPAVELHRTVRVGGAWTTAQGRRLKVWRTELADAPAGVPGELVDDCVVTGNGGLRLVEVQPEGRKRQRAADWRNGARLAPRERLGES
jgi:methionyl-tRNA formyltransferase